jgi:hypothetical protein
VTLAALLARGCDGSQAAAQIDALQGRRSRADAARGRAEGRGLSSLEFEEGGTRGVRIMVERDEDSSDEEDNCTTQDVEFQAAASFNGVREGLELQSNIMTAVAPDYIDHTKSSKFIADLLQICQAWLPLFWSLIPRDPSPKLVIACWFTGRQRCVSVQRSNGMPLFRSQLWL